MFIIPGSICNNNDYAKLTNGFCSTTEEAHQETRTEPKVKWMKILTKYSTLIFLSDTLSLNFINIA